MIWEHTWPASRVIEVATCEDETAEEYTDVAILRFAGSLSSLLEEDFGTRVVEGEPLETSAPPVALQVCQESRTHTLIQYRIMEHTRSRQGSFYFNPRRDMLWLSFDFTDEPEYL
jgi:2EXR family